MDEYLKLWLETSETLKQEISSNDYESLFADLKEIVAVEKGYIYVVVPSALNVFRINKFYIETINNIARKLANKTVGFKFVTPDDVPSSAKSEKDHSKEEERSISRTLPAFYTFKSFEVGESNRLAFLSAMKVAESREKVYNPLYIFGDVGLGKTHLMVAIGNYVLDNDINAKVIYTSGQKFAEDYYRAKNDYISFYDKYNSADVLLVDDIQFLENKEKTQEEFFKIFETLINQNKQIVITSDKPASELKNVMSRLKSRFSWGITVDIKQPDQKLCVNVLKNKLETLIENPNDVPESVLMLFAEYFCHSIRDLEGALRTYVNFCSMMNEAFNEDSFYLALNGFLPKNSDNSNNIKLNVSKIKDFVCEYYKISQEDIVSSSRKATITYARQVLMYLLKSKCNLSLKEIGSHVGNRDHTTVLHAINKISDDLTTNKMIQNDINYLSKKIDN